MGDVTALTGFNGFLGSAIRVALLENHDVLTIGRRGADIQWDLANPLAPPLMDCSAIVHCAWAVAPRSQRVTDMNMAGSLALLDAARAADVPLVFVSTLSATAATRSRYGRSKLLVEENVLAYRRGRVIRPGVVRDSDGSMGMLSQALQRIASLPVRVSISPPPRVPVVGLERTVLAVTDAIRAEGGPASQDLVDEWVDLDELMASMTNGESRPRRLTIPSTLVTSACIVSQRLPRLRDLSDSWLGLTDAARGTTSR